MARWKSFDQDETDELPRGRPYFDEYCQAPPPVEKVTIRKFKRRRKRRASRRDQLKTLLILGLVVTDLCAVVYFLNNLYPRLVADGFRSRRRFTAISLREDPGHNTYYKVKMRQTQVALSPAMERARVMMLAEKYGGRVLHYDPYSMTFHIDGIIAATASRMIEDPEIYSVTLVEELVGSSRSVLHYRS